MSVDELKQAIERVMVHQCTLFANTVPRADHLSRSTAPLDHSYYLRHRIETVRRIWETLIGSGVSIVVSALST